MRTAPNLVRFVVASSFLLYRFPAWGQVSVETYHNNPARTGLNPLEKVLTQTNVNTSTFGKHFSLPVNGQVYAQPLYIPNLQIPGKGLHNVVFVETEHDSVYAFDADSNTGPNASALWETTFLSSGVTPLPSSDTGCGQITPEIGITATPVINAATRTMYVVATTKENGNTVHRLHALDLLTGVDRRPPVTIVATFQGSAGKTVTFDPEKQKARPGLLLLDGTVYTSWGSHCDIPTYYGWLIGYDESTLSQKVVFNTAPDGSGVALWNSGAGPASDGKYIYFETSNGDFNANTAGDLDYGDSFVKYDPATQRVAGYFAPPNQASLSSRDADVGSGGLLLLPDSVGSSIHPHLMVGAGKDGTVYLVDRDDPGGYDTGNTPVESNQAIVSSFGMPAYFNGAFYFAGNSDAVKRFPIANATYNQGAASQSAETYSYPGAVPSISSNGTQNGIVWAIEGNNGQAILHAYSADDLGQELWNSNLNAAQDAIGGYVKYAAPTIAEGKVFAGGANTVAVFALYGTGCATDVTSLVSVGRRRPRNVAGVKGYPRTFTITNTSGTAISGPISLVITDVPAGVGIPNASGTATCPEIAGDPYFNVAAGLEPGQSAEVTIVAAGRRPLGLTGYRVVAGSGTR